MINFLPQNFEFYSDLVFNFDDKNLTHLSVGGIIAFAPFLAYLAKRGIRGGRYIKKSEPIPADQS